MHAEHYSDFLWKIPQITLNPIQPFPAQSFQLKVLHEAHFEWMQILIAFDAIKKIVLSRNIYYSIYTYDTNYCSTSHANELMQGGKHFT